MKRQNRGLTLNTESQWPVEEMEEKMGILHPPHGHRIVGKSIPPIARVKGVSNSDSHHRAVAQLAYEIWEKGGRLTNTSDANWFDAEASLKP